MRSFFWECMNYSKLEDMPYYKECAPLIEGMGAVLVSIRVAKSGLVSVVIAGASKALGVDEMASVHRALLSRMEAFLGRDDLSMEVSSPGIERNIKNAAEFALFTGRGVRIYSNERGQWIEGQIMTAGDTSLVIKRDGGTEEVQYSDIAKAKLQVNMVAP